ncbi:MAG: hypothetical protein HXX20_16185 [Chloroflexi bacterium]|nr:hypothetical protein [Chloroflexota bacterium]
MPKEKMLLVADADRIQDYLFESVNLKEIMGASLLINRFNKIAEKTLKAANYQVIYSAGGVVRLMVEGKEEARQAAGVIENIYQSLTKTGTISFSRAIPLGADFSKANLEVERSLRENKDRGGSPVLGKNEGRSPAMLLSWPYLAHCTACGLRPANTTEWVRYSLTEIKSESLCTTCQAKREAYRQAKRRKEKKKEGQQKNLTLFYPELNHYLNEIHHREDIDLENPEDFGDVGSRSHPSGYVGFIVADGNRMGQKLGKCRSPEEYHDLSQKIIDTTNQALSKAITLTFDLNHPQTLQKYEKEGEYLPLQVLVMGGDDLVIVTTADTALPLASLFCRLYSEISPDLSISAGVVLAKENLPFLISHELAHALLKSAKKSNYTPGKIESGGLDFQVITASNALQLENTRQEMTYFNPSHVNSDTAERLVFTARPYVATAGPKRVTLQDLLQTVAQLKKAEMPRSQLANLYELLNPTYAAGSSTEFEKACQHLDREYYRLVNRLSVKNTWHKLEELGECLGQRSDGHLYIELPNLTPLERRVLVADAIEVYEFVPVEWAEDNRWK